MAQERLGVAFLMEMENKQEVVNRTIRHLQFSHSVVAQSNRYLVGGWVVGGRAGGGREDVLAIMWNDEMTMEVVSITLLQAPTDFHERSALCEKLRCVHLSNSFLGCVWGISMRYHIIGRKSRKRLYRPLQVTCFPKFFK